MNKADLITSVAEKADITHKKAEAVVNTIFQSMTDALLSGGRIEIRGFGSFVNRQYRSYTGRNPRTGEPIEVPPKVLPFFKPGKELRERVNQATSREEEVPETPKTQEGGFGGYEPPSGY